jgi:uncharacterized membrane protein
MGNNGFVGGRGFVGRGPGQLGGHPHLLGWLIFAVLLGLLVVAILYLIRHWRQPTLPAPFARPDAPANGAAPDPALTELRVRFARGELSSEEYARRTAELSPGSPAQGWSAPNSG